MIDLYETLSALSKVILKTLHKTGQQKSTKQLAYELSITSLTAGESYLAILGSLLLRKDDEDRQPNINKPIITSVSFYSLECAVTIKNK